MSDAKLDGYAETLNALARESVIGMPESWSRGTLTIERDGQAINYSLTNANEDGKASIGPALRALCEELYVVMRRNGDVWRRAVVALERSDGDWTLDTTFDYEGSSDEGGIAAAKARRGDGETRW